MPNSKAVKSTALCALYGNWPIACAASLIPVFFIAIMCCIQSVFYIFITSKLGLVTVNTITILFTVFGTFVISLGVFRVFWRIALGEKPDITEVFYYFSSKNVFGSAVGLAATVLGRIIVFGFLISIPSMIIDFIAGGYINDLFGIATPLWMSNLWIFAFMLRVVALAVTVFIVLRHYLTPFLFVVSGDTEPFSVVFKSVRVSRFSVSQFSGLIISLAGWIIVSVFVIPMIFTIPYMLMCYIVHSRFSIAFYNRRCEGKSASDSFGGGI